MINNTNNNNNINHTNVTMRKGSGTKERISITLDKDILKELNDHCDENLIKLSNYIELLVKKGLNNGK